MSHILWLHEDALRQNFIQADRTIHIWDDAYLQEQNYSLKRLVFLYETLCELPDVEILHGNTAEILRAVAPQTLMIPETLNPFMREVAASLSATINIKWLAETPFAIIRKPREYRRFFQYWNQAEKAAFLHNGGADA
jgi:hypothetical protein